MSDSGAILAGDRGALARGLSVIEEGGSAAADLLDEVWGRTRGARRVGITGPPGVGKSTLVAGLVRGYRDRSMTVGVVAVDPTSPFTGGALLGDRHRLGREVSDEGVFFRSFASRGSPGGLARAAPAALDLLDAAGFDRLLLETVGVGQTELEVAATADTVAVVLSPEAGDAVQAMKAGLLEIADVLCVNKADRPGADALVATLQSMLDLRPADVWRPPVVATNALEGADALADGLSEHGEWLAGDGRLEERRRRGLQARLRSAVGALVVDRLLAGADGLLAAAVEEVAKKRCSVLRAAARAAKEVLS